MGVGYDQRLDDPPPCGAHTLVVADEADGRMELMDARRPGAEAGTWRGSLWQRGCTAGEKAIVFKRDSNKTTG